MANAALLVHRELKANKVTKVYLDCPARRATEESKETQERMVNPDTTDNRERTVQLVCPVFPAKWDREASLAKEASPVFQDLQEFPAVKVPLVLKETLARLVVPELLVRQVLTAPSVHLDLKVY